MSLTINSTIGDLVSAIGEIIVMDYEWKQMQEQATFIKANTRKWRARCN